MKTSFPVLICGNGTANGVPGNLLGPAAAVLDRATSQLKTACLESLGGAVNAPSRQWFIDRTPPGLRERITAPTMITQGTVDTLFGPSEAVANYSVAARQGRAGEDALVLRRARRRARRRPARKATSGAPDCVA